MDSNKQSPIHPINSSSKTNLIQNQSTSLNKKFYKKWDHTLYRKTSWSRILALEQATSLLAIFVVLYWLFFILLVYLFAPSIPDSSFTGYLFSIDMLFLTYFTSINASLSLINLASQSIALSLTLISAKLKYGKPYYMKTYTWFLIEIQLFILVPFFTYLLSLTGSFGLFSFPIILFFFVFIILIVFLFFFLLSFALSIPGLIITMLMDEKQHSPSIPVPAEKQVIPFLFFVPASNASILNKPVSPENYCPFRMKHKPGCAFLGITVLEDKKIICNYPETWQKCYVYLHIQSQLQSEGET